jgi:branched-chain amino acid transport system substrate-binding protein
LQIADAVARASEFSREAIKEGLNSIRELRGVTGFITINKDGDPLKSVTILKTGKNGTFFESRLSFGPGR